MNYYLRSRSEILSELQIRVNDTADSRWSEKEKMTALNAAIRRWTDRLLIPFVYEPSTGLSSNSWTFDIPDYIDPRYMRPQIEQLGDENDYPYLYGKVDTWVNLLDYTVEPDGSGGFRLRTGGIRYDSDFRIVFWASPGPLPLDESSTSPVVLLDSTTSMTITTSENNMPRSGFVKIGNEWIQYAGLADGGTTITLSNLIRGIDGTTTATHAPDTTVDWGIAMDRADLIEQLINQATAIMHMQYLSQASPQEREAHTFITRYAQQAADEYWRSYHSAYEPIMKIDLR